MAGYNFDLEPDEEEDKQPYPGRDDAAPEEGRSLNLGDAFSTVAPEQPTPRQRPIIAEGPYGQWPVQDGQWSDFSGPAKQESPMQQYDAQMAKMFAGLPPGMQQQFMLNQLQLGQAEKMRLQRMQNALGSVRADPNLTEDEKALMMTQIQTGINPLAIRDAKARQLGMQMKLQAEKAELNRRQENETWVREQRAKAMDKAIAVTGSAIRGAAGNMDVAGMIEGIGGLGSPQSEDWRANLTTDQHGTPIIVPGSPGSKEWETRKRIEVEHHQMAQERAEKQAKREEEHWDDQFQKADEVAEREMKIKDKQVEAQARAAEAEHAGYLKAKGISDPTSSQASAWGQKVRDDWAEKREEAHDIARSRFMKAAGLPTTREEFKRGRGGRQQAQQAAAPQQASQPASGKPPSEEPAVTTRTQPPFSSAHHPRERWTQEQQAQTDAFAALRTHVNETLQERDHNDIFHQSITQAQRLFEQYGARQNMPEKALAEYDRLLFIIRQIPRVKNRRPATKEADTSFPSIGALPGGL